MGPMMHLKQLEREVKRQQIYMQTAPADRVKTQREPAAVKSWATRLVEMLAIPRVAS
jgi:hypothetical protein